MGNLVMASGRGRGIQTPLSPRGPWFSQRMKNDSRVNLVWLYKKKKKKNQKTWCADEERALLFPSDEKIDRLSKVIGSLNTCKIQVPSSSFTFFVYLFLLMWSKVKV